MFWNDPMLYGASFPYRDIPNPVQSPIGGTAMTPWQNMPTHPQTPFAGTFGLNYQNVPFPMQTPFAGPVGLPWQNIPRFVPPFYGAQLPQNYLNPYLQHTAFTPHVQPFNMNLPHTPYRPF